MSGEGAPTGVQRWITVFNGARDGYQLPIALHEAGRLEALVTDWYSPLDRPPAGRLAGWLPRRITGLLQRRFAAALPSHRVRSRPLEAMRVAARLGSMEGLDARLGRYAGRLARERGAGLIAYNYYAHSAFAAYRQATPGRQLLFQVQAHPDACRTALAEEMARADSGSRALAREPEMGGSARRIEELRQVPHLADRCIVPSTYARSTLVDAGIDPARIDVVPYGVDLGRFRPPTSVTARPFRVLFVGQLTRRKGLAYLLEAWRRLSLPHAELLLVGRGLVDEALLAQHAGECRIVMNVHSRDRMRELYQDSDLFCMPSLIESFGLVYLEAMACGTPVIGTSSTGAPDVVVEGRSGFIVPIRSVDALVERIGWCYEHRDATAAMRARARAAAERFPWSAFRSRIGEIAARAASDGSLPLGASVPA